MELFHDFGYPDPFHEMDPEPADQYETDPNRSGSETQLRSLICLISSKKIIKHIFNKVSLNIKNIIRLMHKTNRTR